MVLNTWTIFHNIENNLRELGFGDVSVNKKMKEINKTLYDILLKLDISSNTNKFKINPALIMKYFNQLNTSENTEYVHLETYFNKFSVIFRIFRDFQIFNNLQIFPDSSELIINVQKCSDFSEIFRNVQNFSDISRIYI